MSTSVRPDTATIRMALALAHATPSSITRIRGTRQTLVAVTAHEHSVGEADLSTCALRRVLLAGELESLVGDVVGLELGGSVTPEGGRLFRATADDGREAFVFPTTLCPTRVLTTLEHSSPSAPAGAPREPYSAIPDPQLQVTLVCAPAGAATLDAMHAMSASCHAEELISELSLR